MKAIQVTMDPDLLEELDALDEVQRDGRSAVLRRAASEYVLRARALEIRERYEHAYGGGSTLGDGFEGWERQGSWPPE